jgi:hypothetical protein
MEKGSVTSIIIRFATAVILVFSATNFSAAQAGTDKVLYENAAGSAAGAYTIDALKTYINTGSTSGTVTNVTGVNANGLTVAVATGTTTPAITVGTSVTGLVKGNGTALSAAVPGTDYVLPTGNVATATLASTVTTNANLTGVVTSTGNATSISANAITDAMVAGLSATKLTGTINVSNLPSIPNTSLANSSITINGTPRALGSTVLLGLQEVTAQNAATSIASSFTGGLQSTGVSTFTSQFNVTPSATSTGATLTINGGNPVSPINSTSTTNVTLTSGGTVGGMINLPLLNTSTGAVILSSSGSETFNGNSTFTVAAGSQNTTLFLYKVTATNWVAALR